MRPWLEHPYVPPEVRTHRNIKHNYERKIAYAVQMQGDDESLPVIIFYGAPAALIKDVISDICKMTRDVVSRYIMRREHSCRYKNGKAYRRIAVEVHGIDKQCMSISDLTLIIQHYIQKKCWCTVKELPLRKLLNL